MNKSPSAAKSLVASCVSCYWVQGALLPLSVLIIALAVDGLFPKVLLTPLLCLIALSYLALKSTVRIVVVWCAVYVLLVMSSLAGYYGPDYATNELWTIAVRLLGFCISCALMVMLSVNRVRLQEQQQDLQHVVASMPVPVLISDSAGNIVLVNDAMEQLSDESRENIEGASYFYLFSNPQEQGKAIASYLDAVDKLPGSRIEAEVLIRKTGTKVRAVQVPVAYKSQRCLMSVFSTHDGA